MVIKTIKTPVITAGSATIEKVLDSAIKSLPEKSVVAITSKVVALCQNRAVLKSAVSLEELTKQESDFYLPASANRYGYHFTISNNTLISLSGIDESNGGNYYVLWPRKLQATANQLRAYFKNRFGLKDVGVIITDSTVIPMRWGTIGLALSYSGFRPLNNYIGKPDLFGRPFKVSQAGIANGLAAAAVLAMGEGTEQTPIAIISDAEFIKFQDHDPSQKELKYFSISRDEDLFGPFLNSVEWVKGKRKDT